MQEQSSLDLQDPTVPWFFNRGCTISCPIIHLAPLVDEASVGAPSTLYLNGERLVIGDDPPSIITSLWLIPLAGLHPIRLPQFKLPVKSTFRLLICL